MIGINSKLKRKKIKVNDYLEFPEQLDMTEFTKEFILNKRLKKESYYNYRLKGVIVHMGTSENGHYYSLIRRGDTWFMFNDSVIKEFDLVNLSSEAFGDSDKNKSAYVLLYEREEYFNLRASPIRELFPARFDRENSNVYLNGIMNEIKFGEYTEYVSTLISANEFFDFIFALQGQMKNDVEYFKILIKYFLVFVVRDSGKRHLYTMYELILNLMKKNIQNVLYLIENLTNMDIFFEFMIECPNDEVKTLLYGMIKKAIEMGDRWFKKLDHASKIIFTAFFDNLTEYIYESVKTKLYAIYGIYIMKDFIQTQRVKTFIHIDYLYSLLKATYIEQIEIDFSENEEVDSAFLKKAIPGMNPTSSFRISNEKVDFPDKEFYSEFATFTCLFIKRTQKTESIEVIFDDFNFWKNAFEKTESLKNAYILAKALLRYSKDGPDMIVDIIEDMNLNENNFKVYFIMLGTVVKVDDLIITEAIFALLDDFIHSPHMRNYILLESTIYTFYYLCTRSRAFLDKLKDEQYSAVLSGFNDKISSIAEMKKNNVR